MATTQQVTPPDLTEVTVSYSAGVKCNLGHNTFENADFHVSRTERYDVTGMESAAVELFWDERFKALKVELDAIVEKIHDETSGIL